MFWPQRSFHFFFYRSPGQIFFTFTHHCVAIEMRSIYALMNKVWKKWCLHLSVCLSTTAQFLTALGWTFWWSQKMKKRTPPLCILEKLKMNCHRQWHMDIWWMTVDTLLLNLSIFFFSYSRSFISCRKAIISIGLRIPAKSAVTDQTQP